MPHTGHLSLAVGFGVCVSAALTDDAKSRTPTVNGQSTINKRHSHFLLMATPFFFNEAFYQLILVQTPGIVNDGSYLVLCKLLYEDRQPVGVRAD
jgi:hypothetical protein